MKNQKITMTLPETASDYLSVLLTEALSSPVEEFLNRPKKGLRSELVFIGAEVVGGSQAVLSNHASLLEIADVLELLHSGSLIVDDIQDGSPTRRDKPALHVLHGLPKALNAGNFLYFFSLKKLQSLKLECRDELIKRTVDTLFEGHIGQALDIGRPASEIDKEGLFDLYQSTVEYKTGALMALGLTLGAIVGGAKEDAVEDLAKIGRDLGFILQVFDDLKNYKFNPDDIDGKAKDEKKLEDFRNLRPGFIWAFAARWTSDEELEDLKHASNQYPDVSALHHWIEKNHFHERSLVYLENRIQSFCDTLERLTKKHDWSHKTLEFTKLVERIKDAYAKS